jgi:hypothetical protein
MVDTLAGKNPAAVQLQIPALAKSLALAKQGQRPQGMSPGSWVPLDESGPQETDWRAFG